MKGDYARPHDVDVDGKPVLGAWRSTTPWSRRGRRGGAGPARET
jgi:hypothetical protein